MDEIHIEYYRRFYRYCKDCWSVHATPKHNTDDWEEHWEQIKLQIGVE